MVAWMDVCVYRKPMRTDWYLRFESHNLTHVKRGVVKCLLDRTRGIVSTQNNLQKEDDHLARVLKQKLSLQILSTMLLLHPHSKQQTL